MKRVHLKRAISCALFLALALFCFDKLTWLFRSNNDISREDIVGFRNETEPIDVVLFGASNTIRFYQPLMAWNQLGYTSYNYAALSLNMDAIRYCIQQSRKTNEAKLYVCDLRCIPLLSDVADGTNLHNLRNWSDSISIFSPIRARAVASYLSDREAPKSELPSYYLDIAKYHSNFSALGDGMHWKYLNPGQFHNVDKGFMPRVLHVPFTQPDIVEDRGELTERQAEALDALLDYCDAEQLPVLFIVCPFILSDEDWMTYNACGDIIEQRGYTFVNFNRYYDEIGLDFETDFNDANHVNFLGSEKYTNYLMNYLNEHYDLPDHRGDARYSGWDRDYERFAEDQQEWREEQSELVRRHLEAKEVGERLPGITDLTSWLELIENESYTLLIEKDSPCPASVEEPLSSSAYAHMLEDWNIDPDLEDYVGVRVAGEELYSANAPDLYEGEIGVDGHRGMFPCSVAAGDAPRLDINGADYHNDLGGIQVVVFDNNYEKVVDRVNIIADVDSVQLVR